MTVVVIVVGPTVVGRVVIFGVHDGIFLSVLREPVEDGHRVVELGVALAFAVGGFGVGGEGTVGGRGGDQVAVELGAEVLFVGRGEVAGWVGFGEVGWESGYGDDVFAVAAGGEDGVTDFGEAREGFGPVDYGEKAGFEAFVCGEVDGLGVEFGFGFVEGEVGLGCFWVGVGVLVGGEGGDVGFGGWGGGEVVAEVGGEFVGVVDGEKHFEKLVVLLLQATGEADGALFFVEEGVTFSHFVRECVADLEILFSRALVSSDLLSGFIGSVSLVGLVLL